MGDTSTEQEESEVVGHTCDAEAGELLWVMGYTVSCKPSRTTRIDLHHKEKERGSIE